MSVESPGSARLWVLTLVLSVTAAVLGYLGLRDYLHGQPDYAGAGVWERLYYTAQMFVLGATGVDKPPYNGPLRVALFLAPLTTVLAVLQAGSAVFRARFVAWRLRHARGHAVVVGAGPAAFVLAQRLAAEPAPRTRWPTLLRQKAPWLRMPWPTVPRLWTWWRRKVRRARPATTVLVGSDVTADVARRYQLRVVTGDPMDRETLRAAGVPGAAQVFALSDEGSANAAVALLARTLQQERRAAEIRARRRLFWRRNRPLPSVAVYARADDPRLVAAMRARRLGAEGSDPDDGYTLDFFNIEQRAAVTLLESQDTDLTRPAAVVGSGSFATAVTTELARRRNRGGQARTVTAVPIAGCAAVPADADRVYVCASDPDEVLSTGLQLLLSGHARVVLCLGRRSVLADALEQRLFDNVEGRLTVFGVLDAACDPTQLRHRALIAQLARALHARYLREYPAPAAAATSAGALVEGGAPDSHVPWERLPPHFRADNLSQAEHIGTKLAAIGAVVVPATPDLPAFAYHEEPGANGENEVEQLARMEHERWMAVKEAAGVCYGPTRTETTHPDYLPWSRPSPEAAELSREAKEKDRMFVRELPALLATEGLAIVRRGQDTT